MKHKTKLCVTNVYLNNNYEMNMHVPTIQSKK